MALTVTNNNNNAKSIYAATKVQSLHCQKLLHNGVPFYADRRITNIDDGVECSDYIVEWILAEHLKAYDPNLAPENRVFAPSPTKRRRRKKPMVDAPSTAVSCRPLGVPAPTTTGQGGPGGPGGADRPAHDAQGKSPCAAKDWEGERGDGEGQRGKEKTEEDDDGSTLIIIDTSSMGARHGHPTSSRTATKGRANKVNGKRKRQH